MFLLIDRAVDKLLEVCQMPTTKQRERLKGELAGFTRMAQRVKDGDYASLQSWDV